MAEQNLPLILQPLHGEKSSIILNIIPGLPSFCFLNITLKAQKKNVDCKWVFEDKIFIQFFTSFMASLAVHIILA